MCTEHLKKDRISPLQCWFHIHVTGFEIQSRASLFPVSAAKQKVLETVAVFSSAYYCVVSLRRPSKSV